MYDTSKCRYCYRYAACTSQASGVIEKGLMITVLLIPKNSVNFAPKILT